MLMKFDAPRPDFAPTLLLTPREPAAPTERRRSLVDPLDQMAAADRADRALLRLVAAIATVTLALAIASALL